MRAKQNLLIIGGLLTLPVFAYLVWVIAENRAGKAAWTEARTQLQNEGLKLDLDAFDEPMPPDSENFCATPLIASLVSFEQAGHERFSDPLYQFPNRHGRFVAMQFPSPINGTHFATWSDGRFSDLDTMRAGIQDSEIRSLPTWFAQFSEELDELVTASHRPFARFPNPKRISPTEMFFVSLPHFNEITDFSKFLMVHAESAIRDSNTAAALDDLRILFQLARAVSSERYLIGELVKYNVLGQFHSIVWIGMNLGAWSDADLIMIDDLASRISIFETAEIAFNREYVFSGIMISDFFRNASPVEHSKGVRDLSEFPGLEIIPHSAIFLPNGSWDFNKAIGAELLWDSHIEPLRTRRINTSPDFDQYFSGPPYRHFLIKPIGFSHHRIVERTFEAASARDLMRVACAIERFRLKNNRYPSKLEELIPNFLGEIPADYFDPDRPLKYNDGSKNGRYRIWSSGRNFADEGGAVFMKETLGVLFRKERRGDLVWGYDLIPPLN